MYAIILCLTVIKSELRIRFLGPRNRRLGVFSCICIVDYLSVLFYFVRVFFITFVIFIMHQSRRRMRDQSHPISPLEQLLRPPLRKVPSGTSMPSAASSTGAAGSSTTSSPPIGKLPVAAPTSIGHFAVIFVMHICRKILLIKTNIKLWTYVLILIVVSVVTDHFPAPRCYFSDKRNILNQYFVKLGWGWTCSLIALLIYFTRLLKHIILQFHMIGMSSGFANNLLYCDVNQVTVTDVWL